MTGSWDQHARRDRILKRIAGGIGVLVFGAACAACVYTLITHGNGGFSEVVTTNTTTTTVLNGHTTVNNNVQVTDYGQWAPYFFGAGAVITGLLFLGSLVALLWPDDL